MMLLSEPSRSSSQIQSHTMATRLQCLRILAAAAIEGTLSKKMAKIIVMRQRGNRLRRLSKVLGSCKRYRFYSSDKNNRQTCRNSIFFITFALSLLSCICAGRTFTHQLEEEDSILPLITPIVDKASHFSKQYQHDGCHRLLALLSLTSLGWVSSAIITALIQGLGRHQRTPKTTVIDGCQHPCDKHRLDSDRITFPSEGISCLAYLALGVLTILLLRNHRAQPKQPSIFLGGDYHVQEPYQQYKNHNLHIVAAVFIAPLSSSQTTICSKIANCYSWIYEIGTTLEMDPPMRDSRKVYQPMKYRLAEAEATKSYGFAPNVEDSRNDAGQAVSTDVPISSRQTNNRWTSEQECSSSDIVSRARREAKRRVEADNIESPRNPFYSTYSASSRDVSSSNPFYSTYSASSRDVSSTYLHPQEPISSPSASTDRTGLRKVKSGILRKGFSPAETEIVPPLPKQNWIDRVKSSFLRDTSNSKKKAPLIISKPFRIEEHGNIASGSLSDLRVIRNLEMEEMARAMGFTLPKNRFGLPEEILGDAIIPTDNEKEVSSASGTMAGLATSGDDCGFTDDEIIISKGDGSLAPSVVTVHTVTQAGVGLALAEASLSDCMAGLEAGFAPSTSEAGFLATKKVTPHIADTSINVNMPLEIRNRLLSCDALPTIGCFGRHRAEQIQYAEYIQRNEQIERVEHIQCAEQIQPVEQIQCPEQGHSQASQGNVNEVKKLRGEVKRLLGQLRMTCEAKNAEIDRANASEAAALAKVKVLERKLEMLQYSEFDGAKDLSENEDAFDPAINTCGAEQTPTNAGFTSTSRGSISRDSSSKGSSHEKSKSQEDGFFKSFISTTEPSQAAFKKLREKVLSDANVDEKDPDLAAKLKVSSRKLPVEAPKPASKEPVPKTKPDARSPLKGSSSLENLAWNEKKAQDSLLSSKYSRIPTSQHSDSSRSNNASFNSINEDPSRGSKSLEKGSAPPSYGDKVASFPVDPSLRPISQGHSRSSARLTGQYDPNLNFGLPMATLETSRNTTFMIPEEKHHGCSRVNSESHFQQCRVMDGSDFKSEFPTDRSHQQGKGAIPDGWDYMGRPRKNHQEQWDDYHLMEEELKKPAWQQHASREDFRGSVGALVHHGDQSLRFSPPSRPAPGRPGPPTHFNETCKESFNGNEAQKEQSEQFEEAMTREEFNLNKSLPEIYFEDAERAEGRKDVKKRSLRNIFSRKQ